MSVAAKSHVSKATKSQWVVEGTLATVAGVLLIWLMLWATLYGPTESSVLTVFDPSHYSLYMKADARGLSGLNAKSRAEEGTLKDVADKMSSGSPPAVIVVTVPTTLAREGGLKPSEIIEQIAGKATRPDLVALDLAQVDTEREAGVFGNAPYLGLKARLEEMKPSADVVVLCSCAPGQQSWSADGLGRSAFSYFLQKGLAGEAKAWDADASGAVTAKGLSAYVTANVQKWARAHRQATQTPVMIPVGKSETGFRIEIVSAPKGDEAGASKAA